MSIPTVTEGLNHPYNPSSKWTVQDSIKCQSTVDSFLDLVRRGQLRKSEHTKLVTAFVTWVQRDPFWGLALPMAPEFRDGGEVQEQESLMAKFPKDNTKDLFHMQEIIDMVERIRRPLSEQEVREQQEWKEELTKAGVTVVGSPEWYERMKEEHGEDFRRGRQPAPAGFGDGLFAGLTLVVGEPMLFGDLVKGGKKDG
ncbi:MAG: hypothetical protein Q9220_005642 [cf. Caloplaca sp. 1 TL-2023]